MRRTDTAYLQHVLDAILKVESYLLGLDESAFLADTRTQDAVVRQLEIIGEATKKVSSEVRGGNPDTPWQDIAGMRDKLIHDRVKPAASPLALAGGDKAGILGRL